MMYYNPIFNPPVSKCIHDLLIESGYLLIDNGQMELHYSSGKKDIHLSGHSQSLKLQVMVPVGSAMKTESIIQIDKSLTDEGLCFLLEGIGVINLHRMLKKGIATVPRLRKSHLTMGITDHQTAVA